MEVILIEEVSHLGHAGELVKVKAGYARNYLLPKRLAVKKSPYSLKILEKQREELEQKRASKKAGYEKLKEAIEKIEELKILVKASKEGKTYGAVTALMIEKQLKTLYNIEVDKSKIVIRKPIKVVGDYELSIIFNKALSSKLKVVVVPLEE